MKRLAGLLACALLVGAVTGVVAASPAAAADSRAVVVIDTGSGVRTAVISFSGTISGLQALQLAASTETYGFAGQGLAVCRIDGVGHDATNGSCLGTTDDPRYWSYYRAPEGAAGWSYSGSGAGATTVRDGDVEGWRFGVGGKPPFRSFCDLVGCAPPPPPAAGGATNAPATDPVPPPAASNPAGAPGGAGAGLAPNGVAVAPAAAAPAGSGSGADAGATSATSTPAEAAGGESGRNGRGRGATTRALGRPRPVDDGGAGSPVGVLAAAGIVLVIGGAAVVLRRRSRAPG